MEREEEQEYWDRVYAEVTRRYRQRRAREIARDLLMFAAAFGAAVALVYYWRMS